MVYLIGFPRCSFCSVIYKFVVTNTFSCHGTIAFISSPETVTNPKVDKKSMNKKYPVLMFSLLGMLRLVGKSYIWVTLIFDSFSWFVANNLFSSVSWIGSSTCSDTIPKHFPRTNLMGWDKTRANLGCLFSVIFQTGLLQIKTRKIKNPLIMFNPPKIRSANWK